MKEEDGRRRSIKDWLVWGAVRINVGVSGGGRGDGGGSLM